MKKTEPYETTDGTNLKVAKPVKVESYRAADGTLHATFQEAVKRNERILVIQQVEDFLSIPCILSVEEDLPLIAEYIVNQSAELMKALTPPTTPKE